MKKIVLASMLLLLMLVFASCAAKNVPANKSASINNIKFEYFYRGFVTLHNNNEVDTNPKYTLIIQTDEDWHDFMDKFVPGIPYYTEIDFSKDCLVFNSLFPAKPFYSIGADINTFVVNGGKQ